MPACDERRPHGREGLGVLVALLVGMAGCTQPTPADGGVDAVGGDLDVGRSDLDAPGPCPDGCDDSNACTDDTCGPGGCAHVPIACDDGTFCNGTEVCDRGVCVGGTPPCSADLACAEDTRTCGSCSVDADCAPVQMQTGECTGIDECNPIGRVDWLVTPQFCDAGACTPRPVGDIVARDCPLDTEGAPCGACGTCVGGSCAECAVDAGTDGGTRLDAGSDAGVMATLSEVDWQTMSPFVEVLANGAMGYSVEVLSLASCFTTAMAPVAGSGLVRVPLTLTSGDMVVVLVGPMGVVDSVAFTASSVAPAPFDCPIGSADTVRVAALPGFVDDGFESFARDAGGTWRQGCTPTPGTLNLCP